MDLGSFNARLVWATPVRPDLLGRHLEAFTKVLPIFKALRLCHRFGKGPKAHITKIPQELVLLIEDFILEAKIPQVGVDWIVSFKHFEGRCEPIDHALEAYAEIYGEVEMEDEVQDMLCEACKEDGTDEDCPAGCAEKVDEHINQGLLERDESQDEECRTERDAWEAFIDQGPNGNFVKYDKILRKYFGLQAHFETTRTLVENSGKWPSDKAHKWHADEALQTTICYLHLPCETTGRGHYHPSLQEGAMGVVDIKGFQSYIVDLPTERDREERVNQFGKALRVLRLKPYVHGSQLNGKVSAEAKFPEESNADPNSKDHDNNGAKKKGGKKKKKKAATKQKAQPTTKKEADDGSAKEKEMAKLEWPQLIMGIKTHTELT